MRYYKFSDVLDPYLPDNYFWNRTKRTAIDRSTMPGTWLDAIPSNMTLFVKSADGAKATLSVDLPGVKRADLTVTIEGESVKVVSMRHVGDKTNTCEHIYSLPELADKDSLYAQLADGVLTLTVNMISHKPTSRVIEVV